MAMPPALYTTPTGHSGKPRDSTRGSRTTNLDGHPADTFTDMEDGIDIIPRFSVLSPRSLVRFVLGNIFVAMFLISLTIFIIFFAVNWFILRDVRSMNVNLQVFSNSTGVSILGDSLELDLDASVLSISWKLLVCGADTASGNPFWDARIPAHCEPFDKALDVYINDPSKPIFSSAPHTDLVNKQLGIWDPPRFTVEHTFNKYGKRGRAENPMVPFQHYSFNAFVFAIDPTTNHSIRIATLGVLGILGDFVVRSHDVADTSEFTYNSGNGLVTTEVESRVLRVEITRSAIAKAFAICLFLVNWALTVGSVYITALVASRMLEANSVVAALPFSAPLTIPMVRSLYAVSPPPGTSIDAVAFFVQIVTVGLCSLILFGVLTSRQPLPQPSINLSV